MSSNNRTQPPQGAVSATNGRGSVHAHDPAVAAPDDKSESEAMRHDLERSVANHSADLSQHNSATQASPSEIEDALWALHSYESNRSDAGRVYSEADITRIVEAVRALREAVRWILNDAAYKAPEQIGIVAERWLDRLRACSCREWLLGE